MFKDLADWRQQQRDGWELEIVDREPGARGFHVQPRRWIVERSFAWLSRKRRLAKDYERKVHTSETRIESASACLLLRRCADAKTSATAPNAPAQVTMCPVSAAGALDAPQRLR